MEMKRALVLGFMVLLAAIVPAFGDACGNDPSDPSCAPSFQLTWHVQGSGQQHDAQSSPPVWTGSNWFIGFTPQQGTGFTFTGGQLASSSDPFISYSFGVVNSSSSNMVYNFDYTTTFNTGIYPIYAAETFFFDGLQCTGPCVSTFVTPLSTGGYYNYLQTSLVDGVIIPNFQLGLGCPTTHGVPCVSAGPYNVFELYNHSSSGTLEIKGQFTLGPNANYTISGETDLFPAPEPGTLALVGAGIFGLAGVIRRKINQ
jgi:PEP-CTERM motif-containing protein